MSGRRLDEDEIIAALRSALGAHLELSARALALLFAADRHEHVDHPVHGIRQRHERGESIVCDRYLFSSLVYQTLDCPVSFVYSLNAAFPLPATLIFIDTPVAVCQRRLGNRCVRERFESETDQEKVRERYQEVIQLYRESGMAIHRLDGSREENIVFEQIYTILGDIPII